MYTESRSQRRAEVVDEASKWGVGLGIITMALFPLALPILLLTAVALLPLAVPLVAIGLVAAVVALPFLVVRGLVRRVRSRGAGPGEPSGRLTTQQPAHRHL